MTELVTKEKFVGKRKLVVTEKDEIIAELGWPDTFDAEYLALTELKAMHSSRLTKSWPLQWRT